MQRRELLRSALAAGAAGLLGALAPPGAWAGGGEGLSTASAPASAPAPVAPPSARPSPLLSPSADRLVIVYRDGTRADAGGGRLVWRSAEGRVLDDRPLDPADLALLEATLAQGGETLLRLTADPARAEISDWRGWREVMEGARYSLTDPRGRPVARRPLAPRDLARLRELTQ